LFSDVFFSWFSDYLNKKIKTESTRYEYMRVVKKFLEKNKGLSYKEGVLQNQIDEFLSNLKNPHTHRNYLSALKHLFRFIESEEYIKDFKFKPIMPTFSIKIPSLEQIQKFGKEITHKRIQLYFYTGIVTAIRPQHLLRLTKGLFDRENNMITTWQKTFGIKNFFFSFYTDEVKPLIEAHLDTLQNDNEPVFNLDYRYTQKVFRKTSKKTGVKMTPKTMRKFATNWFR